MASRSLIGQTVGKYKIAENLGRGGMAEVFKAYQESLDRFVAIKVMHSFLADEEGFLGRFQREARAMAALNHPNIVGVYDFDVFEDMYYIVMEFVSGGTLKDQIERMSKQGESMALSASTRVVLEVADALAYAHGRGMVHRDIKPGNIMLTEDGRAVLTDFGIAKILSGPSFTATGAMVGTPAYMSPEQGLGQAGDERSDLYALGVLYYQMATGRLPYDADTPLAVILKHVNEPIPVPTDLNDDIPEGIQGVIIKAMAKDPNERYQSANGMIQDLQAAARASDLDLAAAAFITGADRLTPPPGPQRAATVDKTRLAAAPATVMAASASAPADATRMASAQDMGMTEVVVPPVQAPPAPPAEKKSRLGIILIALLVIVIAGAAGGYFIFAGSADETPTPDDSQIAGPATETPSPEPSATPTVEPEDTVDVGATAVAAIAATLTAEPTKTALPTSTAQPTVTPSPDLTATFLASCEPQIALANSFTYQNESSNSAPVDSNFPISWVLVNDSPCPVETGAEWAFVEGEDFGQTGPVSVAGLLEQGDETTLTLDLRAPSTPGRYESTWQLHDVAGSPLSRPLTFLVVVYEPQTPTPVDTPTPEATATSEIVEPFGRNLNVVNCQYAGQHWQCDLVIQPYGGRPPYTATVSDQEPPKVYEGTGPFIHRILWGRCSAWVNNIAVQDTAGQVISRPEFYDPNVYFEGGCTLP